MSAWDHYHVFIRENVFSLTDTTVDHFKNKLNNGVTCQIFEWTFRSTFDLRVTIKRWITATLGKNRASNLLLYRIAVLEKKLTWNYKTNDVYFQIPSGKKASTRNVGFEKLRMDVWKLKWPITIYFYLQLPHMTFTPLKILKVTLRLNILSEFI